MPLDSFLFLVALPMLIELTLQSFRVHLDLSPSSLVPGLKNEMNDTANEQRDVLGLFDALHVSKGEFESALVEGEA